MPITSPPSPSPRQSRLPGWHWLVPAVLLCLAGCREPAVRVESDPVGATVWIGEEILGPTPLELPTWVAGKVTLRLALPGCTDKALDYDAGSPPPERIVRVSLEQPGTRGVRCESDPPGADVFVDGEFRGRTPMDLRHLEQRPYELVFMLGNRKTITQTLDAAGSDLAPTLRVVLPSLTEEYYRQQIEREPHNLHHFCDLAHHYILELRFDDAMAVFGAAVTMMIKTPGVADAERLWSEMDRVIEEQYDYGSPEQVNQARRALCAKLGELLKANPEAPFPSLHLNYILALDSINERQKAQEAFERAWRRFPNEEALRRLRRQGFAAP